MLTPFVIGIHLIVSLLLIGLVLLHSGKGGGLSDMFGGSVGATALGSAAAERNLDRITVVVALTFVFTTTGLAFLLELASRTRTGRVPARAVRRSAALAAAVLLAACFGGDDDAGPDDPALVPGSDEGAMRLGIAGPLVVDPAEASLASPSDLMVLDLLYDGLTGRSTPTACRSPALATEWDANDELDSVPVPARPRGHLLQRAGPHPRRRDRLPRAGDGGRRLIARGALARGRQGLWRVRRGRRRARQRTHLSERRHRPRWS